MENYQKSLDNIISSLGTKPTLALHSCCGPCSSYVLEYLTQFFDVTLFFYNPNIHPDTEYQKRLAEQKRVCDIFSVKIVECEYNPDIFFDKTKGLKQETEGGARCSVCFELRLFHTAKLAASSGFTYLASTLTVSPHKNAPLINEIGKKAADENGILWLPSDFKKRNGYLRSIQLSRQHGIYRQDYCGCIYSKKSYQQS